ncbi:VOC family protein [Sphingobium phenoxybenzoativorans]|uniref:VOC family protein n=1 Tax=Sphingobium phenoxybenzoativorans TaxID=1592790 RepID=UPI0008721668|nr:VOC family protein [Sphingobium phenoxybenzoativorans]
MITIKRQGHIAFRVSNLDLSKEFYTSLLGLHVMEENEEEGVVFLGLRDLSHTVDLVQSSDVGASQPHNSMPPVGIGFHHVGFELETQDQMRDAYFQFKERGVNIIATMDHGSQQSIYFNDPDGNILEVYWQRPDAIEMFAKGRGDDDRPLVFE